MIDICFSDSACGNINCLLRNASGLKNITSYLASVNARDDVIQVFSVPSNKTYAFALWYDQYGISDESFLNGRMEILSHYYERPCNAKRKYNIYMKEIENIISTAKQGEPIRIWHSQSAFAMCGLYYFADILRDANPELYIVPLPENDEYLDWSQMYPGIMPAYFHQAHRATDKELKRYSQEWTRLKKENADLRITVKGKVKSVNIEYYDDVIISAFNKNTIYMRALVGNALNIILDGFICDRILDLINKGRIKVVGSYGSNDFYDIYPPYILELAK